MTRKFRNKNEPGLVITEGKPFSAVKMVLGTWDVVKFPGNWLTHASDFELLEIGYEEFTPPPEPPKALPTADKFMVTNFQLRVALEAHGWTADADTALQSLGPDGWEAKIRFDYQSAFSRVEPFIVALFADMGVTAEQGDTFWMAAKDIR